MKSLQDIYINRDNAILVIVDIENEFCRPGGKRYKEENADATAKVIASVQGLMERCRAANVPIIYIQSVRNLREPEFTVFGKEPFLIEGTWAVEFVDELKPRSDDIVVPKHTHDAFYETDLNEILRKLVPDPTKHFAIITGGATEVCMYQTVLGFYSRNYWTVIPIDCTYSVSEKGKQETFEKFSMRSYRSIFLTRSDLITITEDSALLARLPTPGK